MTKRFSMSLFQLVLYAAGFVLLFAALVGVTYYPPNDGGPQLLNWLYGSLGILAGHILGTKQGLAKGKGDAPAAAGGDQLGRTLWAYPLVLVVVALAVSMLSGCAGTATSFYTGLEAKVHSDIARTADATVKTLQDGTCDLPRSAGQRDAKLAAAQDIWCGSLPATLSPSEQTMLRAVRDGQVTITPPK